MVLSVSLVLYFNDVMVIVMQNEIFVQNKYILDFQPEEAN